MELKEAFNQLKTNIAKHSPTILTVIAAIGVVGVAWTTYRATLKANDIIVDELEKRQEDLDEQRRKLAETGKGEPIPEFTNRDIFQLTWRCYAAPAGIGIATIACIIGVNQIHRGRYAALISAYGVTTEAYKAYKAKVAETFGKNKELKVRDAVAADKVKENPSSDGEVIFTGKGEMLCYDSLSGRYFHSEIETIRQAVNHLNRQFLHHYDTWMSLNDFYNAIDLPQIRIGDFLGWDIDKGLIEVTFSSQLTGGDSGKPCVVVEYNITPKYYKI